MTVSMSNVQWAAAIMVRELQYEADELGDLDPRTVGRLSAHLSRIATGDILPHALRDHDGSADA